MRVLHGVRDLHEQFHHEERPSHLSGARISSTLAMFG
jgi:hypothetical protein